MNRIINIRGTNGSGKTTVARAIMRHLYPHKDYTTKNGVFTHLFKTPANLTVAVIGRYNSSATGGVDRVKNVRDIVDAVAELAPHAHIVMEGLLLSGLQQLTKDIEQAASGHATIHALTLDTPKDKCIEQTLKRRVEVGNDKPFDPTKSLIPKYRAVELAHLKMKSWGMDARLVSQKDALIISLLLLNVQLNPEHAII